MINGGADPISGKHMAVFYKEIVPNAKVVILDDIGHYPQTEAPNEVLLYYYKFREEVY
ncbi:alpha/beta hydrolase [Aquimarina sp. 2201CG1-2-11]|uniref:alpha/beta fold hydrolase n=1 Tax=Aquimarina discodermiae TaxID=3231043 RepID=UPI00346275F1